LNSPAVTIARFKREATYMTMPDAHDPDLLDRADQASRARYLDWITPRCAHSTELRSGKMVRRIFCGPWVLAKSHASQVVQDEYSLALLLSASSSSRIQPDLLNSCISPLLDSALPPDLAGELDPRAASRRARSRRPAPNPLYTFLSLGPWTNSLRILHLLPGHEHEPIKCLLFTGTGGVLGDAYEALSYVWGSAESAAHIKVNGRAVRVTPNLFSALNSLRYDTRVRSLWVDALCINQDDDYEKSWQVALIGHI